MTIDNAAGSGRYAYGTKVILAADEKASYAFKEWKVTKGSVSLDDEARRLDEIEIVMPAEDVRIEAVYTKNTHQVTVNSGSGTGVYEVGATVEITADPAANGSQFKGWKVIKGRPSLDNSSMMTTSFIMPDQDITIECEYALIEYKLVVNNGSGSANYHLGDNVSIFAEATKNGMRFDYWTVDHGNLSFANAGAQNITFSMPAEDLVITAHYTDPKYVVKVVNGKGSGMYAVGDEVVISAEPYGPQGASFVYWNIDQGKLETSALDLSQPTLRFTMPDNALTIRAYYALQSTQKEYVLLVNGGTGSGQYAPGMKVVVQANAPSERLHFAYWIADGYPGELDVKSTTMEIVMPEHDVILTAFFSN